jgi:hypothetical protein
MAIGSSAAGSDHQRTNTGVAPSLRVRYSAHAEEWKTPPPRAATAASQAVRSDVRETVTSNGSAAELGLIISLPGDCEALGRTFKGAAFSERD